MASKVAQTSQQRWLASGRRVATAFLTPRGAWQQEAKWRRRSRLLGT
jgi:hypothetical protein